MASSREYLDSVLGRLPTDEVTFKPMMGEYVIYFRGKVVGGVYDDRFLLKPTASVKRMFPSATSEPPYEGAKEMVRIDDSIGKEELAEVLSEMYGELPEKK